MPAQETISEQTRPAPNRRPCRRKAWTLTPAIGARTTRVGISTSRIHQGSRRFTCAEREIVARPLLTPIRRDATIRARDGAGERRAFSVLRGVAAVKEVILTPEGYEKLKQEIEFLSTDKRREVAERIRVAREFGDIAENAEYDDAKNEQMLLEHRIQTLEERLRNAQVIDKKSVPKDVVSVGSHVKLRDVDAKKTFEYDIVGSAEANPTENKLSNESPVGKAIIGHKKGETVEVAAPRGALKFKILEIKAA